MGYLYKEDRNMLMIGIINEINVAIIKNISKKQTLTNLNKISKLCFLEDIDEILERQYEIYKDEILIDIEQVIEDVILELEDCISCTDHWKMIESTEYQLDLVNELKESLFEDIEESYSYDDLLSYLSRKGKEFRHSLIKLNYNIHSEMNSRYNNWNILIYSNRNVNYNLAKHLLILK